MLINWIAPTDRSGVFGLKVSATRNQAELRREDIKQFTKAMLTLMSEEEKTQNLKVYEEKVNPHDVSKLRSFAITGLTTRIEVLTKGGSRQRTVHALRGH
jgi:hypothetical protein